MLEAEAPLGIAGVIADPRSLGRLARRYRLPLVRYFTRRGLAAEAAEDCAQDVFLRIVQAEPGRIDNPEAYLFRVAANVLVDRARREQARPRASDQPLDAADLAAPEHGPARIFEDREALKTLAAVIGELPTRTREIFLLNRLEGLSYTQLAARYLVNVKVIEREMGKALAHVRRRFPQHDRA